MQMIGKEVLVTPVTLESQRQKREEEMQRRKLILGNRESSIATSWQAAREREATECAQEEADRLRAKAAPGAVTTTDCIPVTPVVAPVQPLVPGEHRSRNVIFVVGEDEVPDEIDCLSLVGNTVVRQTSLDTGLSKLSENKAEYTWVNLRVVITTFPTTAALSDFIQSTKSLFPIQPSIVIVTCDPASLASFHKPPYVVVTASNAKAAAFVEANKKDLSVDEEKKEIARLTADQAPRDGQILIRHRDQDLRMNTRQNPLSLISVSMHWKGVQDLDLSCIALGADGSNLGIIHWGSRFGSQNCFEHRGDVKTAPHGAAETILVFAPRVPINIAAIYFVVTSYGGEPFSLVESLDASVTLGDEIGREPFAQLPLTECIARLKHRGPSQTLTQSTLQPEPLVQCCRLHRLT
eukprot:TRINITY_DN15338_c0_g1_i3.p1 TRINITY_DN15338_c0_g1~~TRINITY_DN15338_c0_g1_i3.p1  ORF type:complete len:432 (-),score=50.48 TRINITY_DN15338_c0_g1_i3:27-1250(-)